MTSKKTIDKVIEVMANDLTYIPIPEQRRLKEAFWHRWAENPYCDPRDITLAVVQQSIPDSRLEKWWGQVGFREWFRNREEFRERVEFMTHLALDAIQDVLISSDPKSSSAKVNAAKLMFEIARKIPSRTATEKYVDEKISEMDKKQLEEYISRQMKLLPRQEQ